MNKKDFILNAFWLVFKNKHLTNKLEYIGYLKKKEIRKQYWQAIWHKLKEKT